MSDRIMNERIAIKYAGRQYWARLFEPTFSAVSVGVASLMPVYHRRQVVKPDEESARRWLSDNGLRKSKAKKLLAAALRNEGDYADPNHPNRISQPQIDTDGHGFWNHNRP